MRRGIQGGGKDALVSDPSPSLNFLVILGMEAEFVVFAKDPMSHGSAGGCSGAHVTE